MAWDLINEPRCYKCGNSVQVQSASDGLTTYLGCLGPEVNGCGVFMGQGRAGQGRAGQGRAGQGRAGQGRAGQGRAGQGWCA